MRESNDDTSWVVYETPATARMSTMKVVCEQGEWDRLTLDKPEFTLVQSGITNEGEAERLARDGTAGLRDAPKRYR
jgi:hypothetical protein